MSKIHVDLIKGLTEEKKQKVHAQYDNAQDVLRTLRAIVEKRIQELYVEEEQLTGDPLQLAGYLGERRGLRTVLKYLPE